MPERTAANGALCIGASGWVYKHWRGGVFYPPDLPHERELAWQLTEALCSWYATASAATAANGLDAWIASVNRDGAAEMCKALSAFRNWRREILAFFDFLPTRLSNGEVSGKNNRTKAIMRQGYGYRNRRNLRMRILLEVASWISATFTLKDGEPNVLASCQYICGVL